MVNLEHFSFKKSFVFCSAFLLWSLNTEVSPPQKKKNDELHSIIFEYFFNLIYSNFDVVGVTIRQKCRLQRELHASLKDIYIFSKFQFHPI